MISRIVYPPWFNEFWSRLLKLKTRDLGSKHKAHEEAKKVKMGPEDVEDLIQCFRNQTDRIRHSNSVGTWIQDHTDIERWIKRRTWEDEACQPISELTKAIPRSDQRKAEALARYRLRHMGNSVEPVGGGESDVGDHRLNNVRILENKT